ncbi:MAG: AraC family transcriptional regulator [Flavobacterium sp.]
MKAQTLELTVSEPQGVLDKLAEILGTSCVRGYVEVPQNKGSGYLQEFVLGNSIGMMVRDCEFNEDLLVRRTFNLNPHERILMTFNNVLPRREEGVKAPINMENLPSVQIGKGKLNLEMLYPSHTNFRSILVAIYSSNLKSLLGIQPASAILKTIFESDRPTIFEEVISPQIQKVALDIIDNNIPETMQSFYYRLKAEELICLIFAELLKRENAPVQAINETDAEKIYQVKAKILSQLSKPPILDKLAIEVGMSKSKLKRLFKQVFGESIFKYYQNFRMREAARLLKERKLTVSEVGYQMGFSNLSHFTRVFEEHIGVKPKKFALQ